MFVVAMTLPSGYTTNDKEAASQNEQTKMVELVGNEVTGYFDEVSVSNFRVLHLVSRIHDAVITSCLMPLLAYKLRGW